MKQMLSFALAGGFILACLFLLGVMLRFCIVSEWRTRGWQKRLRHPQVEEVAARWEVHLSEEIAAFYRESDFVKCSKFCLARAASAAQGSWYIHNFVPFTVVDLTEWIKITGVPGLPLATGGDDGKSVYFLPIEALRRGLPTSVLLRLAGLPDVEVAPTLQDFACFQIVESDEE